MADALGNGMRLEALRSYFGDSSEEHASGRSAALRRDAIAASQTSLAGHSCARVDQRVSEHEVPSRLHVCSGWPALTWDTADERAVAAHHWRVMRTAFGQEVWRSG